MGERDGGKEEMEEREEGEEESKRVNVGGRREGAR